MVYQNIEPKLWSKIICLVYFIPKYLKKSPNKKNSQFSKIHSHNFCRKNSEISSILVIFGRQIHQEPKILISSSNWSRRFIFDFPAIFLIFEKMFKIDHFLPKKMRKILVPLYFWIFYGKMSLCLSKKLTFFFWLGFFLISRFSFFYSALFFLPLTFSILGG